MTAPFARRTGRAGLTLLLTLVLLCGALAPACTAKANLDALTLRSSETRPKQGVSVHGLLTWEAKENSAPFSKLPVAAHQETLPREIYMRDETGSYNRDYEIALRDGILYVKHRGVSEKWREAPMPDALKGYLTAISVDADEIIALDDENWIYTCIGLFDDTSEWKWMSAWGELFRVAPGYQLPNASRGQWVLSNIDRDYDETYTDADGRKHQVGGSGCTTIFYRSVEDPTRIIYLDPWLPNDESRESGTPYHSRFKVQALSASASELFVTNKYGDMFTRLFDYDLSGGDQMYFKYSWFSQEDSPLPDDHTKLDRHRVASKRIRLPSPYWQKVPKIPGEITDRISVESTAPGSENRLLKVEGRKDGRTGYWKKTLTESTWTFVPTDEPLKGQLLENSMEDTSEKDLAPLSGIHYSGRIKGYPAELTIRNFAYNDSIQTGELRVGFTKVPCTIYTEYGNLGTVTTMGITAHEAGLTDDPRYYMAALVVSDADLAKLKKDPFGKSFVSHFMLGNHLRPLSLKATDQALVFGNDKQLTGSQKLTDFTLKRQ